MASLAISRPSNSVKNLASMTGAGALLPKLLELLGFFHQTGGKCLKLVRGRQVRAVSREASESKSELPKIFDDVRSHECMATSTTIGR
jgi:hypothetical protein